MGLEDLIAEEQLDELLALYESDDRLIPEDAGQLALDRGIVAPQPNRRDGDAGDGSRPQPEADRDGVRETILDRDTRMHQRLELVVRKLHVAVSLVSEARIREGEHHHVRNVGGADADNSDLVRHC